MNICPAIAGVLIAAVGEGYCFLTDGLSYIAVIISLLLWRQFGWALADPIFAAGVGVYILFTAWQIARGSLDLLMDRELPDAARERIRAIALTNPFVRDLHDLKTRSSGQARFIQFHLELDGDMALVQAHTVSDEVEAAILAEFPGAEIIIHEDPAGVPERRWGYAG